ncbi:MAG: DUF3226 domain-containing protein, partial [Rhodospirillaceae bacterium]
FLPNIPGALSRFLELFVNTGVNIIGIASEIRDDSGVVRVTVDTDKKISYILTNAGYNVPKDPEATGTIIQCEGKPRIGIWLMPDNQASGMIEDFVKFLVPEADALIAQACQCVADIKPPDWRFEPHLSKAEIHTWLAWQKSPGTPLGSAINQKYLDADCQHAKTLITWLSDLFGDK